jgi:OmpA-OmpF porin, OOP family
MHIRTLISLSVLLLSTQLAAQTPTAAPTQSTEAPAKVVASGTVPDEASRATILGKLRDLYGAANVVDRLEVGGVVPPPNWSE